MEAARAGGTAPEITSSTRLVMCCACMHDLETWAALVEAIPFIASGEAAAAAPRALPPCDWLVHFTNEFAQMGLDASWQPCIERTLELQQSMVHTSLTGDAHKWEPYTCPSASDGWATALGYSSLGYCVVDGVYLSHIEMEVVDETFESHPSGEAVCAEASAILNHIICESGGKIKQSFPERDGGIQDRLFGFTPSGLLEQMCWFLAGVRDCNCRCMEEKLKDGRGCRLVCARWDAQQNKLLCETDCGLACLSTMTVTYEKSTRSWRLITSDLLPFPHLNAALAEGLKHMGNVYMNMEIRRLRQQFTDVVKQRAAAANFVC